MPTSPAEPAPPSEPPASRPVDFSNGDLRDTLRRAAAQWDRAERIIKQAERLGDAVVLPSINELRYAGRRLVDAINLAFDPNAVAKYGDSEVKRRVAAFVHEVEQNCLRAEHDAVDASITFLHGRIGLMVETFGSRIVYQFFPKYIEMNRDVAEAEKFITLSRENREQRPNTYAHIADNHLPRLLDLYDVMKANEDAIIAQMEEEKARESDLIRQIENVNARLDQAEKDKRKGKVWTFLGWGVALLASVIGALPTVTGWLRDGTASPAVATAVTPPNGSGADPQAGKAP